MLLLLHYLVCTCARRLKEAPVKLGAMLWKTMLATLGKAGRAGQAGKDGQGKAGLEGQPGQEIQGKGRQRRAGTKHWQGRGLTSNSCSMRSVKPTEASLASTAKGICRRM